VLCALLGAALPFLLAAWCVADAEPEGAPMPQTPQSAKETQAQLAAWGSDHVGRPVPEFITGDECLFCHRTDVGPGWAENRHQQTLRPAADENAALAALRSAPALEPFAAEVEFLLGGARRTRFLKRGEGFGTLSLLSAAHVPAQKDHPARLIAPNDPRWEAATFGRRCAGCHATGVDSKTHAFSAASLDCFVCHGDATIDHSKDASKMILAMARKDPPRVVVSICAQCHIRSGRARSTGLPYPNNFVAGDNLFRDFEVDFSDAHLQTLNPADRHVLENVRDVALRGREEVTCLSCHDVHAQSSRKHHRVASGTVCLNCHNATGPKSQRPAYEVHSPLCEY